MDQYLRIPIQPVEVDEKTSIPELLDRMGEASFQGRTLSQAYHIWERMLSEQTTIFLGLAGALVPAGMRKLLVQAIENRWIDCLVSTGANLFHDIHEELGRFHWRGTPLANDRELKSAGIDRIYDTFASEDEFRQTDEYIAGFAASLDQTRPYSTREFLNLLGEALHRDGTEKGILSASFEAGVPIYCPAIGDSSIGIAIASGRHKGENSFTFDVIADVLETSRIAAQSANTGVIYLGGGTPKNFIQQTEVTASILGETVTGHKYAIQIITDPPHWGGLSGCTFAEAQSWGKIAFDAAAVTVYCDVTIALPLVIAALEQKATELSAERTPPKFRMERQLEIQQNDE